MDPRAFVRQFTLLIFNYHCNSSKIKDSEEMIVKVDGLLNELNAITMKHKGGLLSYWGKQPNQQLRVAFQKQ